MNFASINIQKKQQKLITLKKNICSLENTIFFRHKTRNWTKANESNNTQKLPSREPFVFILKGNSKSNKIQNFLLFFSLVFFFSLCILCAEKLAQT